MLYRLATFIIFFYNEVVSDEIRVRKEPCYLPPYYSDGTESNARQTWHLTFKFDKNAIWTVQSVKLDVFLTIRPFRLIWGY